MDEKDEQLSGEVLVKRGSIIAKISRWIAYICIGILPIFALPGVSANIQVSKSSFFVIAVLALILLWIAGKLSGSDMVVNMSFVHIALGVFLVSALISVIFSPYESHSFFGFGYETGTFLSLVTLVVMFFLVPTFINTSKQYQKSINVVLLSALLLFGVQLINIFKRISFVGLSESTSSLVGTWNGLSLFFGLALVIFSIQITVSKSFKSKSLIGYILMLAGVTVINHTSTWWILLAISVVTLTYFFIDRSKGNMTFEESVSGSDSKLRKGGKFWALWVVLVMSLAFVIFGNEGNVGSRGGFLNIATDSIIQTPLEVKPALSGTISTIKNVYQDNPVLGVGLNRFDYAWREYRPESVLQSAYFWNYEFNVGYSYILTLFSTMGILGAISIIFLLLSILYYIAKGISYSFTDTDTKRKNQTLVLGVSTLFSWTALCVYTVSLPFLVLTFFLTSIYISLLGSRGLFNIKRLTLNKSQVSNFLSVLMLVIVAIFSVSASVVYSKKALAWVDFSKGVHEISRNNLDKAEELIDKAVELNPNDTYYRIRGQLGILKLDEIANRSDVDPLVLKAEFENKSAKAHIDFTESINLNDKYYLNYLSLSDFYEALIKYGFTQGYEAAVATYNTVEEIAPGNPLVYLEHARLELGVGNREKAIDLINKSVEIKPNYTDALFLRSQIAIANGNVEQALSDTVESLNVEPSNTGLLFFAGYLSYASGSYDDAINFLARAISFNPGYSNARYFLGLALLKAGYKDDAINQFKIILELNPGHEKIIKLIDNLENGRDPFAGIPDSDRPEVSTEIPIPENQ